MDITSVPQKSSCEDPLLYLPCSEILKYGKGELIYGPERPSNKIYLVIDGKVKICRQAGCERPVIMVFCQTEEFFGESAFLDATEHCEEATALEPTKLMTWSAHELEEMITKRPRLGIALIQRIVHRSIGLKYRTESFAREKIPQRLGRALITLSERFGGPEADGSIRCVRFSHELLAQYVGTAREVVTAHMGQFRKQGYIRYSRKAIYLKRDAMEQWLRKG
jgi:CRP/FNR family transcriptional regulator